jgi:hypothetical protein
MDLILELADDNERQIENDHRDEQTENNLAFLWVNLVVKSSQVCANEVEERKALFDRFMFPSLDVSDAAFFLMIWLLIHDSCFPFTSDRMLERDITMN